MIRDLAKEYQFMLFNILLTIEQTLTETETAGNCITTLRIAMKKYCKKIKKVVKNT